MRYKKNHLNRKRKPGGGRKGTLSTPELKLFFILFYLKSKYPPAEPGALIGERLKGALKP
jgi:hypothetical protein